MIYTLNYIVNLLLQIVLFFPPIYIWVNYLLRDLTKTFFISTLLTILTISILKIFFNKKNIKLNANKKQKEEIQLLEQYFLLNEKCEIINYYFNLLKNNNDFTKIVKFKNYITAFDIEKNSNVIFYFEYNTIRMNLNDFYNILKIFSKKIKTDNLLIFCNDFENDINILKNNLDYNIKVLNIFETYNIFLQNNLPVFNFKIKKFKKLKFKEFINILLSKANTKNLIYSGFIILIFSFFSFYNIYYLVFSTFLFILAIFSYFNKKTN